MEAYLILEVAPHLPAEVSEAQKMLSVKSFLILL